jgi:hypothetical protein
MQALDEQNKKEGEGGSNIGVRLVLILIPVPVTTRLLAWFMPLPLASGASMFAWMLIVYWFPSRGGIDFHKWLVIVTASALAVAILSFVVPAWF